MTAPRPACHRDAVRAVVHGKCSIHFTRILVILLSLSLLPMTLGGMQLPRAAAQSTSTILRVGINANVTTLDPDALTNIPLQSIASQIFEPLMRATANLEFVPGLAVSYQRPDDRTWRFRLRSGVKFHDGQPFTADDVVYSIIRIKDEKLPYVAATNRAFFANVERAVAVNPLTVDIVTKTPTAFLLHSLQRLLIVPRSAERGGTQFGIKPIGTGPFRFVELVPGSRLVLEANGSYWGPKPKFSTLIVRPLVESPTRFAALQTGEVQVINSVPIDALAEVRSNRKLRVESTASTRTIGLVMRTQRPPFNDIRVRQAAAYAIDIRSITAQIFRDTAVPANSPFAPNVFGALAGLPQYEFNPERSRRLLAEAGYPNGIAVKYGIPLGNYLEDQHVGEAIADMLQKAGFRVEGFEEVEWATFFPTATSGKKYDIYLYGLGSPDPSVLVYFQTLPLYHDWQPPQVSELFARANAGPPDRSLPALQDLQRLLWNELPWVFLYYQPQILAMSANVTGVPARADEYLDFRDAVVGISR